jgi:hypothetical protein
MAAEVYQLRLASAAGLGEMRAVLEEYRRAIRNSG